MSKRLNLLILHAYSLPSILTTLALLSNNLRIKLFELWDWVRDSFVAPEGIWNISINFPQSSFFSFLLLLTNRPSRDEATLSPIEFLSRADDDEDDDEIWSFFGSEQSILVIFWVKLSVTISQLYFTFNIRALGCIQKCQKIFWK